MVDQAVCRRAAILVDFLWPLNAHAQQGANESTLNQSRGVTRALGTRLTLNENDAHISLWARPQ